MRDGTGKGVLNIACHTINLVSLPRLMDVHHNYWNIRTIQDIVNCIHQARRSAILDCEFGKRTLDIIPLSEVRLPEKWGVGRKWDIIFIGGVNLVKQSVCPRLAIELILS